jgi:hypothetical protein
MKNKMTIGAGLFLASLFICVGCAHKRPAIEQPTENGSVSGTTSAVAPTSVATNPNLGASSSGRSR